MKSISKLKINMLLKSNQIGLKRNADTCIKNHECLNMAKNNKRTKTSHLCPKFQQTNKKSTTVAATEPKHYPCLQVDQPNTMDGLCAY